MTRTKLSLFDTTLRDGQQTPGVTFSLEDKLTLISLLNTLGVDYIEGGYPGGNPTDTELFAHERPSRATFTAFGMTKRAGRSAGNDPGLQALLQAKSKAICFVAKSWDYHVRVALGCSNEENLETITDSVKAAKGAGKEVLVDCEHFFDGYKANAAYALSCAKAAYDAGARWVVLCDTNGGTLPAEVREIVGAVIKHIPGGNLGIHAHNDTEQAVANSLAAVEAGVCQIQGTLNGIGERCGNANLISLIGTLGLKPAYAKRFEIGANLSQLTHVSRAFDELLNRAPNAQAPYVGKSAFATKAGIHASAIAKEPETYEHVRPDSVGNARAILVSDQAGKSNLLAELSRIGLEVKKDDARLDHLLREVKEREAQGFSYDGADASFELLARRILGLLPHYFDVESFDVNVGQRGGVMHSRAQVKVKIGADALVSEGEGNGPVSALDMALRKDLGKYQKYIDTMELVDYKVRILNGSTSATTRVLIESGDTKGRRWFTVGVSPNIVEASFIALNEAITFKLLRDGVAPLRLAAFNSLPPEQRGVALALLAHSFWAAMAPYFHAMAYVNPWEIAVHRAVWSVPIGLVFIWRMGLWPRIVAIFKTPRLLGLMCITSISVVFNWVLYIWCLTHGRTLDASLGYFINPLMNVAAGFVFLHERFSKAQAIAIALAVVAVIVETIGTGIFPVIGLSLAVSFSFYGFMRKVISIGPVEGFMVEVLLCTLPLLGVDWWLASQGVVQFGHNLTATLMLMGAGFFTTGALLAYATSVRLLRYSTSGLLQYVSPSAVFLIAIFFFGERLDPWKLAAFVIIWVALAIYSWAAIRDEMKAAP